MNERYPFLIGLAVVVSSLALSLWYGNGMSIGVCAISLLIAVPAVMYCDRSLRLCFVLSSGILLLCTVIMMLVIPIDAFARAEDTDWSLVYLTALMTGLALMPQMILFFFTFAAVFKASFNWAALMSIGWLVGAGMLLLKYLAVLWFQNEAADAGLMITATIVTEMLICILMFAALSMIVGHMFRKGRIIITSNGLERMT